MKNYLRRRMGIAGCLLAVGGISVSLFATEPPGAALVGSSPVLPNLAALRNQACSGGLSGMNRTLRIALFAEIETMTAHHLRVLSNAAASVRLETNVSAWVAQRAAGRGIPTPDRTIIAALLLQTDLLDAALASRNPSRLESLRQNRSKKFVRKKEDRIFGDLRDHIFLFCADELQVIAGLQAELGGRTTNGWHNASPARTPKEAENFLVEGMSRLAQRAKELP